MSKYKSGKPRIEDDRRRSIGIFHNNSHKKYEEYLRRPKSDPSVDKVSEILYDIQQNGMAYRFEKKQIAEDYYVSHIDAKSSIPADKKESKDREGENDKPILKTYSSSNIPAKTLITILTLSLLVKTVDAEKDEFGMIKTDIMPRSDNKGSPSNPRALFFLTDPSQIQLLTENHNPLQRADSGFFNNTPIHLHIANGGHEIAKAIIDKFPEQKDQILVARDINDCTPLFLAMKMDSPKDLILELMNKDNVMMADKEGVTPLMLAVRGMDIEIAKKIRSLMSKEQWQDALKQQDQYGRTVKDWLKMDRNQLRAYFEHSEIDSTRSSNYPFNSLLSSTRFSAMLGKYNQFKNKQEIMDFHETIMRNLGLEACIGYSEGEKIIAIKATKKNAEMLNKIASANQNDHSVQGRQYYAIKKKFLGETTIDPQEYWKGVRRALSSFINEISDQSVEDVYLKNQKQLKKFMKKFIKLEEERPSRSPIKPKGEKIFERNIEDSREL